jgi:hypothetical protein
MALANGGGGRSNEHPAGNWVEPPWEPEGGGIKKHFLMNWFMWSSLLDRATLSKGIQIQILSQI